MFMSVTATELVRLEDVTKVYGTGEAAVHALRDVSLVLDPVRPDPGRRPC